MRGSCFVFCGGIYEYDGEASQYMLRRYDENGRIINLQRIYLDGDTSNQSLIYECD